MVGYNYSIHKVYRPTNITGGHHAVVIMFGTFCSSAVFPHAFCAHTRSSPNKGWMQTSPTTPGQRGNAPLIFFVAHKGVIKEGWNIHKTMGS